MKNFLIFSILCILFIAAQAYKPVKKPCRYGYEIFDCEDGSCNNITKECTCPTDRCRMLCRAHYNTDEKGCAKGCECDGAYWELWKDVEKHGCPQLRCGLECEEGYEIGVGDCPICRCRKNIKRKPCRRGFDEYDCEPGLECNSKTSKCSCLASKCFIKCPHGFARDEKGCPLCRCLPTNKYLPEIPEGVCPEVRCLLKCSYGYAKNFERCPVCRCASQEEAKREAELEILKQEWLKCLQRNRLVKFWHRIKNLFTVEKICGPPPKPKSILRSAQTWDWKKELKDLNLVEDYDDLQAASFPGDDEAFAKK